MAKVRIEITEEMVEAARERLLNSFDLNQLNWIAYEAIRAALEAGGYEAVDEPGLHGDLN